MKYSYRNTPALKCIEDLSLRTINISDLDRENIDIHQAENSWVNKAHLFAQNIYTFTSPFFKAMYSTGFKLLSPEITMAIPKCSGTLILPKEKSAGNLVMRRFVVCFNYQGGDSVLEMVVFCDGVLILYATKEYSFYTQNVKEAESFPLEMARIIVMSLAFFKFADIEIKYVNGRKKFHDQTCKYVNDTNQDIQIMDCKWFTTLVHSDAFKVSGHLRLQPCGEGMKDKKLIWINEFGKHGYTSHFKRPINLDEVT